MDGDAVAAVSEAEHAMWDLNSANHPAIAPLARLLLRTESIASSKIEGMQLDVHRLARAEAPFVPPPEHVAPLLKEMCAHVNRDGVSPLIQAAMAHAQFETIHPFADGNGRTGRALIHVILRRRGVVQKFVPPISLVFAAGRRRYIDGLTAFRGDNISAWILDFAAAATRASLLAQRFVADVEKLRAKWRDMLRAHSSPRADAVAWSIIDLLPAHPIITAGAAIAATSRDKSSVSRGLDELCAAGVLRPATESKRNRLFEAPELLKLIQRIEQGRE
ncbi:MAG TPA: Fic family protein [Gemmatimonadaceae bacterium]|jgi:Fic family protein|nr:Fic family protein [Gemmatimonadaceae bacterium]